MAKVISERGPNEQHVTDFIYFSQPYLSRCINVEFLSLMDKLYLLNPNSITVQIKRIRAKVLSEEEQTGHIEFFADLTQQLVTGYGERFVRWFEARAAENADLNDLKRLVNFATHS